ncbi:sulfurtransferase TusA family protein [Ferdinandcohnia sp. SAFN-114]|uniref:sulfurtransferase TusA family protein n=1 Tax=Ferdinandcohnia sp. SAFN-114 TaxID=3387275 RepID=UPI003F7F1885
MNIDEVLNAKGLACPMPIVKTKKALDGLQSGQILQVLTTDKGAKSDLTAWAASTGHEILDTQEENGVLTFYIKKGEK